MKHTMDFDKVIILLIPEIVYNVNSKWPMRK